MSNFYVLPECRLCGKQFSEGDKVRLEDVVRIGAKPDRSAYWKKKGREGTRNLRFINDHQRRLVCYPECET